MQHLVLGAASDSDAAVRLRRFEALVVSYSLHGKTEYHGFIGSVCAPDKATLKAENHALECTTAGPYNAIPSDVLGVGCVCGLGSDFVGIHSISLAARFRVAACSTALRQGLQKIQTDRGHNRRTPVFALSAAWEKEFLTPSMAWNTMNAFDHVCGLDREGKLDAVPPTQKQKIATEFLCAKLYAQDFAGLLSTRASRILGPISRHRIADMLPHMKRVSCASRLGLTVGILQILCNGPCAAQRFHNEEQENMCRVGFPDGPDSFARYNVWPRFAMWSVLFGGWLAYVHGETIFYVTSSLKFSYEAYSMASR